jgi:hypothetical protein
LEEDDEEQGVDVKTDAAGEEEEEEEDEAEGEYEDMTEIMAKEPDGKVSCTPMYSFVCYYCRPYMIL